MTFAQPFSYLRGSIWSYPLSGTSFTHLVLPYLGLLPKVIHPLTLLCTEAGDPLPLKEGAPTHLVPIKGQVHNTPWPELTLHPHYRFHTWPLSTFWISPSSLMILYCMMPHGLQCQPNFLQLYQSLKGRQGMTPPIMS
jgi:hypothetical protein